ncbi:MAG: nucleoside phosphorylase [Gammaproteobacteria bacterium]|nr:nucleoside phosphorylase [Gammaproteobacteria bacterium]MDH3768936.1 nucleoside phosphorylase [Gammaproteobacteria bacterium]
MPGEIAPHVLLPGDPARAARIAEEWFDDAKLVMVNREFHSYTGTFKGLPVSVISTGLGSPGAAMVVQDLKPLGVKAAIRVGTAGSVSSNVVPGDIVVGTAAVRDEGTSHKFIPANYPATAHFGLTGELLRAAKTQDVKAHVGIVHTSDAFKGPRLADEAARYAEANVLAFEMEAATVLTLGALLSVPTACVFSIDGWVANVVKGDTIPDASARDRGIVTAIDLALNALTTFR